MENLWHENNQYREEDFALFMEQTMDQEFAIGMYQLINQLNINLKFTLNDWFTGPY